MESTSRSDDAHPCPDANDLLGFAAGHDPHGVVKRHLETCTDCGLHLRFATGWTLSGDKSEADRPLLPGSILGRYRLDALLGSGGMGTVFAAHDTLLDRPVALKVLRRRGIGRLAEARCIARIQHPNVVRVHDSGEIDGRAFLVMERVDGTSLEEELHARRLAPRDRLRVLLAAGRGLEAVHAAGVAHGDFKPANILVGQDGGVWVVDFGLARAGEPESPTAFQGTPMYMAPEQLLGAAANPRADQYAFAATLYHAFVGRPHRPERDRGRDLPSTDRVPGLGRRQRAALRRAFALDPADRHPSMGALLDALAPPSLAWRLALPVGIAVAGTAFAAGAANTCEGRSHLLLRGLERPELASAFDAPLERWTERWLDARTAACDESKDASGPSQAERCLDDLLVPFAALLDTLNGATGAPWEVAMVGHVPEPEVCTGGRAPFDPTLDRAAWTTRWRSELQALADVEAAGGVALLVLLDDGVVANRLLALTLPAFDISDRGALSDPGPLWGLVPLPDGEVASYERDEDLLIAFDPAEPARRRTVHVEGDIRKNGRGLVTVGNDIVGLFDGHQLKRILPSGATEPLAELQGAALEALAVCADGAVYGAGTRNVAAATPVGETLLEVDLASGRARPVGERITDGKLDVDVLACASDGHLYGADTRGTEDTPLWRIDPRTGRGVIVGTLEGGVNGLLPLAPP